LKRAFLIVKKNHSQKERKQGNRSGIPLDMADWKQEQKSISPYSAAYLHRLNRILKQRKEQEKIKSSDVCSTRSTGSMRTFTGNVAKLHISEKEFGIPSRVTKADEVPRFCYNNYDVMRIIESANRSKTTSQRARSNDKSKKRLSIHGNLESVSMYVIDNETTLNMSKALQSAEMKVIERNSSITPWISCINGTKSKHRVVNSKSIEKEKFDIAIRSAPSYKLGKWIRKSPSKSAPSSPNTDSNMNYIPFSNTETDESTYFDAKLLKSPIKLSTTTSDYTPEKIENETMNNNENTNVTATSEINKLYVSVVESKVSPEAVKEPKSVANPDSEIGSNQSTSRHVRWLAVNLYTIPRDTSLLSDSILRSGHHDVALSSVVSVDTIVKAVAEKYAIPRDSVEAIMVDNVLYSVSSNAVILDEVTITEESVLNIYCVDDSDITVTATDSVGDNEEKKRKKKNKKGKKNKDIGNDVL
jgi:hypothetical protein